MSFALGETKGQKADRAKKIKAKQSLRIPAMARICALEIEKNGYITRGELSQRWCDEFQLSDATFKIEFQNFLDIWDKRYEYDTKQAKQGRRLIKLKVMERERETFQVKKNSTKNVENNNGDNTLSHSPSLWVP